MMGTGRFALPTFLSLYDSPHEVVGLFTQPDRVGRGHHHHPHPMKEAALERGTPVFQPDKVNTPEALRQLQSLEPDLCVVAAYGQILSPALLGIPRLGTVNLHASLLPRYRGAAPVQYAVLSGETETGVTIFRIEPKLDAGPVLAVAKLAILPEDTAGSLESRLADLAVPVTREVLDQFARGDVTETTQDPAAVTKAPRLNKADGAIPWEKPATVVSCHIRGMQPWPNPYTFYEPIRLDGGELRPMRLIVTKARPVDPAELRREGLEIYEHATAGMIVSVDQARWIVQTGEGLLEILELKPEGKRDMTAADFLHGHQVQPGDRLRSDVAH